MSRPKKEVEKELLEDESKKYLVLVPFMDRITKEKYEAESRHEFSESRAKELLDGGFIK